MAALARTCLSISSGAFAQEAEIAPSASARLSATCIQLDGAIFYIPEQDHPAVGTVPLYRLFNGDDHMVSLNPHEGEAQGYHVEEILGVLSLRGSRALLN